MSSETEILVKKQDKKKEYQYEGGELDEKVSVARLAEELFLDLLAVFVHGVSNLAKVNRCILKHG